MVVVIYLLVILLLVMVRVFEFRLFVVFMVLSFIVLLVIYRWGGGWVFRRWYFWVFLGRFDFVGFVGD